MRRATALLGLFVALAVLHTWPLASDMGGLSRLDNDDTGLNVWIVAWVAHIVPRRPLQLFEAPMFHPEPHALAYSEHMLVPGLMGAPFIWAGASPVAVYNLLVVLGFALSGWTMSLVVRRWTGSTVAAATGGMLFAFNAHLLTRIAHLQALHVEFFPLALFAFDRLLTAPSRPVVSEAAPTPRHPSAPSAAPLLPVRSAAIALVAAFVLQSLCSNYSLVLLSGALVVAAGARAPEWLSTQGRYRARWLVLAGVASTVLLVPFLWPYYQVHASLGLTRSIEEVRLYSATWLDYLATGGRLHYDLWSHRFFEGRTALFPGVTASVLALTGLVGHQRWRDARVRMTLAIGIAGLALSFGPALPGYEWLHEHVPLLQGIRAAARWGFLLLLAVAILAGDGVARLERRWGASPYWPAVVAGLIGLVTLEALRAPMALVPFNGIPAIYQRLADQPGAVVELPLYAGPSVSENARYLVGATVHFRPLVNGYSGFESQAFRNRAERWRAFPSDEVLDEMRQLGVTHVMVHVRELTRDQVEAADRQPRLILDRDDGERRLYRLVR